MPQVQTMREHGVDVRVVDASGLRAMEPALGENVVGAVLFPGCARCTDPLAFSTRLVDAAVARGARIVRQRVARIQPSENGTWTVHAEEQFSARRVVVAAGVWSGKLLAPLGYRVPIETERGYHLMLPNPGVTIRRPMIFQERHFCATGLLDGLRLAGTVEFAGTRADESAQIRCVVRFSARIFAKHSEGRRCELDGISPVIPRLAARNGQGFEA